MKQSFGILMYRIILAELQFLLVHPGGPFFKNKDAGVWSIPKGEGDGKESPLDTAKREFKEEIGFTPTGKFIELTPILQRGGKTIDIPEVDKGGWFNMEEARLKINERQVPLLEELQEIIKK
ncbi:MAG: NUDIX domain-containing protein [Flavobacterium sp.]|nr:MAG: NUDIX domain-containing protein [Flavobacterium sp.]